MAKQLVGHIKAIYRYPIKSMQGEPLNEITVDTSGLKNDRGFALRLNNGRIASAKRTTSLLNYHAYYDANDLMIQLPSGETIAADQPYIDERLSELLGIPVSLEKRHPEHNNFAELDSKTIFADTPIQEALEGKKRQLPDDAVQYDLAQGSYFDSAHLHILTTGTLKHLDNLLEGKSDLDVLRFRPNILVESLPNLEGFIEDDWIDATLLIGQGIEIADIWPTLRCVMTTLPQQHLANDPSILRKIVKSHDNHLGVFAKAVNSGNIKVGDEIHLIT